MSGITLKVPSRNQALEWLIDGAITYAGYHVSKGILMSEGSIQDQPLSLIATLGVTFAVFKLARQWKAIDK